MQINLRIPERAIEVRNTDSLLMLQIDKKLVFSYLRTLGFVAFFAVLAFLLITTFQSGSEFFWPLLKGSFIVLMVGFMALHSNRKIKTSNK